MARLDSLLLCDFAQVREGLLFVNSGGITRVFAEEFPAHLSLYIGAMMYVPPDQVDEIHEIVIAIKDADRTEKLAEMRGAVKAGASGQFDGEGLHLPFVVPLLGVQFKQSGQIDIQASVDGDVGMDWTFWIQQRRVIPPQ